MGKESTEAAIGFIYRHRQSELKTVILRMTPALQTSEQASAGSWNSNPTEFRVVLKLEEGYTSRWQLPSRCESLSVLWRMGVVVDGLLRVFSLPRSIDISSTRFS